MTKPDRRNIPGVDDVLAAPPVRRLREAHPRFPWTPLIREILDALRSGRAGDLPGDRAKTHAWVVERLERRVLELRCGGQRRVLNGTGVILHTNLGRALLGETVSAAAREAMAGYVNLEIDLETGGRSHRAEVLNSLVALAAGAEAAMVVNNNAAAVYLVVNSLSPPGRIIVSRGELVEIGGSFRLPDILQRAAAEVVEVGTTNRTYAQDYARVAKPGDVFMRAHRSNYEVRGFTHEATLSELVALARDRECHVVYDLGSGSFFDFSDVAGPGEECVSEVVATGVDGVTMSADKLLGGVQAGLIVGTRNFVSRLADNPLRRAVRVDKITITALQALLRTYLFEPEPVPHVPALAQAATAMDALWTRGRSIADAVGSPAVDVVEDAATMGGGSLAGVEIPSVAVRLKAGSETDAARLAKRMRGLSVPVICRIRGDELRVNLRTIPQASDEELSALLRDLMRDAPTRS